MNKAEYIQSLSSIYTRVGTPAIAKPDAADIALREDMGQKWYMIPVTSDGVDGSGNEISKTGAHYFYVYDEGLGSEYAVAMEKAAESLIPLPQEVNTFQEEANEWFESNKAQSVVKYELVTSNPDNETCQYKCYVVSGDNASEDTQLVWRTDGVFSKASMSNG